MKQIKVLVLVVAIALTNLVHNQNILKADIYDKKPTFAELSTLLYVKDDNTLWEKTQENEEIKILDNVQSVSGKYANRMVEILKTDGSLWLMDYRFGSLENGVAKKISDNVKYVSSTDYDVIVVKNDNTLWGMGENSYGCLGVGHENPVTALTKIDENVRYAELTDSYYTSLVYIKEDNSLWGAGYNNFDYFSESYSISSPSKIMDDVQSVYISADEFFVTKTDNSLWTFNSYTDPVKFSDNIKKVQYDDDFNVFAYLEADGDFWVLDDYAYGYEGVEPQQYAANIKDFGIYTDEDVYVLSDKGEWSFVNYKYERVKHAIFEYELKKVPDGLIKIADNIVDINFEGNIALSSDKTLSAGYVYTDSFYKYFIEIAKAEFGDDEEGLAEYLKELQEESKLKDGEKYKIELEEIAKNVKLPAIEKAAVKTPEKIENTKISLKYNGKDIETNDAQPYISNSRVMVPVRVISEYLGAEVEWNEAEQKVLITKKDGTLISMKIGDKNLQVGDKTIEMDAVAEVKSSRTFVPIRYVAEALGINVEWIENTKTVLFTEK